MANICCVCAAFYADDNFESYGLEELYDAILENRNSDCPTIDNLLTKVGLDPDSFPGTGLSIEYVSDYYITSDGSAHFFMDCDCRWSPHEYILEALASRFDVQMVYEAEEEGCGLFINSDKENRFFGERYHLDLIREGTDVYENCCSEEEAVDLINDTFATSYATLEDVYLDKDSFEVFGLYEFEAA